MILGSNITGTNMHGIDCAGMIIDRVRTVTTLQMEAPAAANIISAQPRIQQLPFAIDAYLVLADDGELHLVMPQHIDTIGELQRQATASGDSSRIPMGPGDPGWKEWVREVVGSQTVPPQYQGHNPQPVLQDETAGGK